MTVKRAFAAAAALALPLTLTAIPAQAAPPQPGVPKGYSGKVIGNLTTANVTVQVTCPKGKTAEIWAEAAQEETQAHPFVWISTATVEGQIATGRYITCTGKPQKFTLPWSWEIVGEPLHKGSTSFVNVSVNTDEYGTAFSYYNKKVV
jgi:hypothetical protein